MKLYFFGYIFSLFFALSPNCAGSQMNKTKIVSASTETSVGAQPAATVTPVPPKDSASDLIWQGTGGNFAVKWTKQDIRAKDTANDTEVFSARKMAAQRLRTVYSQNFDKKGEPNFESFTFGYKIAALVGNFLFLKESTAYSPQTYTTETFLTIDLNNPTTVLSLENFYSQDEILQALLNNPEIKKDLQDNDVSFPPTLAKFYSLFYTSAANTTEGTERVFDRCWFPKNILESFTIAKAEADKVEVNLGMPCRAGMRDEEVYNLRLSFPMSEKLKKQMTAADREQAERNQAQIAAQTEETNIGFDAKSLKKSK